MIRRATALPCLLAIIAALVFPLHGCGAGDDDDDSGEPDTGGDNPLSFPEGFLFGAATAGFQVDMGCPTLPPEQCTDPNSDWYQYVTSPEMIRKPLNFLSGEDPQVVGPGHWELYEQDYDLAANQCRHNAFRMSIEWSRIFPEPTFGIEGHQALRAVADPGALAHYHRMFEALRERGLTPLVTLHHYTLPLWIHDGIRCHRNFWNCSPRGWLDPWVIVPEIAKYAGFVAREFGDLVDLWATQNEPLAVLLPGFLLPTPERINPPSVLLKKKAFKTAFAAMVDAHARMYDAVKAGDLSDADGDGTPSQVGLVYAMAPVRPIDPGSPLDLQAAENVFYLWNLAFLDAVALGMFDADLVREPVFRQDLASRMDYVGLNYKVRLAVEGLPFSLLPGFSPLLTLNPLTLVMDEIYPKGIYDMTLYLHDRYGLPVIVTENNGQSVCKGDIASEVRLLVEHLTWVSRAAAEGADVRGYFYWSLMDNYEWNQGTGKPLGLYAVDPADPAKRRIPRETVEVFAAVAGANAIPPELAERYPIDAGE